MAFAPGCSKGVQWRYDTFDRVHADSRRHAKLTLVYFRSPYSVQCTRVEEQVFNAAPMKAATQDILCVPLDYSWDKPLADAWGIAGIPAYVIVSPSGEVLERVTGEFSLETVLDSVARAKARAAGSTEATSAG